jgi:hypothetical protein
VNMIPDSKKLTAKHANACNPNWVMHFEFSINVRKNSYLQEVRRLQAGSSACWQKYTANSASPQKGRSVMLRFAWLMKS